DQPLIFGDLVATPYSIYHDAVDPVGYMFTYKGKKIVLATDMGKVDRHIVEHFCNADGILLEFNHDINMVEVGAYPFHLKRRILGDPG
ncbi:MAG: MBL fold metallo-hydrolase, partial [Niameybacter sp.]